MFGIRKVLLAFVLVVVPTLSGAAEAQSLKDRLKQKAQERVEGKADQAADKLLDRIEKAVKCVVGDDECVAQAKTEGKEVVLTDDSGRVLPPDQQPASSPAKSAAAGTPANSNANVPAAGTPAKSVVWANYDFIPGERVLFADDFSGDRVGNFPQRLELASGNMEVVEVNGARFVRATSISRFFVNLPEVLPQRFTFEFDVTLPWEGMIIYGGPVAAGEPLDESALTHSFVRISGVEAGITGGTGARSVVEPRRVTGVEDIAGHMFRVRVHGDGKYLKVYLNEHRISNIPNSNFNRTNRLVFELWADGDTEQYPTNSVLIGNITVNAGGRDMYDALLADGRVVTQGIFFDVGSDRLRPESTPTLKMIGDMLKSHADLKLVVEGHTDNTGNAASNQTLSEKRAQAIVAALTSTYGIDATRLTPAGFGASKPAKPNDTAEGRQQNRRVELVRK